MMLAPIKKVTEFDIAKYISDLPCGLSIGQAFSQIPKYRTAILKSCRRTREANYVGQENAPITAARCVVKINEKSLSAVVDSDAASSIMTKKLMKTLGFQIDRPSSMVVITANGTKVRSLGEIKSLPLVIGTLKVNTPVQVLDSADEVFILGNDWLKHMKALLDWKNGKLTIQGKGKIVTVPVKYTKETSFSEENENESEDEEELEEWPIYFSDSSSFVEEDLEYNPWSDCESPNYDSEDTEDLHENNFEDNP